MTFEIKDRRERSARGLTQPQSAHFTSQDLVDDHRPSGDADTNRLQPRAPVTRNDSPSELQVEALAPDREDQDVEHAKDERHEKPPRGMRRRHPFAFVGGGLILLFVALPAGYLYWDYASHFESTDDAFIAARQFPIAPKVPGYLTVVPVTDNEHVVAGQVIARIDDRDYRNALAEAQAQVGAARANIENIDAQIVVQQAQIHANQAQVDQAQLDLSHTIVTADQPGRVVQLSAAVGEFAQPGTNLSMFVPDDIWVWANFKENQLDHMRPGQPVTLEIDAYPERTIHGHVASVQPGSGTAFSLLPVENATGHYVKIVQRVPVKLVMNDPPGDVALGPGMSVVPMARIDPAPSLLERLEAWL